MIWVYAVCDRPEQPPQPPLEAVRDGDLLAVFCAHDHAPDARALDALWAHEQVVEELMAERTVLPMRFGTTLPDAGALREAIAARHEVLAERLDFVRDRVELGVRAMAATPAETPPPDAVTGREYLLPKLGTEQAAAALHEPLTARAVASNRRTAGDGEVLHATYLVHRDDVAPFLATVERLNAAHVDVALLCTGPWPPYSFVRSIH